MKNRDVYFRTEKGIEELAHRSKGLSSICRHVLILINGKITVGELTQRAPDSWNIQDKLTELEVAGLISNGKSVDTTALGEKESADQLSKETPAIDGSTPKGALMLAAEKALGGSATKVIERIKNSDEDDDALKATTDACVKLVTLVISESKAAKLRQAFDQVINEIIDDSDKIIH